MSSNPFLNGTVPDPQFDREIRNMDTNPFRETKKVKAFKRPKRVFIPFKKRTN
jgi:hypothetical protein